MELDDICKHILNKGIESVKPKSLVYNVLSCTNDSIIVSDRKYYFTGKLNVFGFGKAALGLVKSTVHILKHKINHVICCIPKPTNEEIQQFPELFSSADLNIKGLKLDVFYGPRTNEPDENVVRASLLMAKVASEMVFEDLLLVCITGGGSAMLTLPQTIKTESDCLQLTSERVSLNSIVETSKLLSLSGASIEEINSVRGCLDAMKSGGLAKFANPAQTVSLILSDVIGDPLEFIASGPTYIRTDNSCPIKRAQKIIDKYNIRSKMPLSVIEYFETQLTEKSNKKPITMSMKPANHILGNIHLAVLESAKEAALIDDNDQIAEHTIVKQNQFERIPTNSFKTFLPVIITVSLCGDMEEKAFAMADLAWNLRELVLCALKETSFTVDSISTDLKRAIINAHDRILLPEKKDSTDLFYTTLHVANLAKWSVNEKTTTKSRNVHYGLCLFFGGEATVKLDMQERREKVNGGRCSHAALTTAIQWYEKKKSSQLAFERDSKLPYVVDIGFLARATDGLDGPTAFGAGAWSSLNLIQNKETAKWAYESLKCGNSYGFYERLAKIKGNKKSYLEAALTGTNVMDLFLCVIDIEIK